MNEQTTEQKSSCLILDVDQNWDMLQKDNRGRQRQDAIARDLESAPCWANASRKKSFTVTVLRRQSLERQTPTRVKVSHRLKPGVTSTFNFQT